MKLSKIFARFYKSFNYDHVRKINSKDKLPWDLFREKSFPYIAVPLDQRITTIVGANESGKSHLLSAIRKAITGKGIEPRDLCRYSPFFGVAQGQRCYPHVGVAWDDVSEEEAEKIASTIDSQPRFDRFLMFREAPDSLTLWLPDGEQWQNFSLNTTAAARLAEFLPQPFEIRSEIAIPNAIPFAYLLDGENAAPAHLSRNSARQLVESIPFLRDLVGNDGNKIPQNSAKIYELLKPALQNGTNVLTNNEIDSLDLGRRLLIELGNVDPSSLKELARAVDDGDDGYASALVRSINEQLDRQLNFRRYWVQDRDFGLRVVIRHRELAFTITDRTGTEYMFSERSSGLRYYLSYLVQAQVHRPASSRETILLMDEPDTYLSAEAQQDLMRVLRDLAEPPGERDPIQVVYVTHSPFLLDKNHSERIRVLEKGTVSDGTRVVPNVNRNHYEPLRSAFGAFVGETAFVGAVNLLVEGPADQILLAAAAGAIRKRSPQIEDDSLDLNRIVIVPCGSAGEAPHTLFRVRGQGSDKPPAVILLDSDKTGRDAKKALLEDRMLKRNISAELVLDVASIGSKVGCPAAIEIEDLIPPALAHFSVAEVVDEIMKFREGPKPEFSRDAIEAAIAEEGPLIDAINRVVGPTGGKINKVDFARATAKLIEDGNKQAPAADVTLFLERMRALFRVVNSARRQAEREAGTERLDTLVEQRARLFKMDHPAHARREQGRIVLDEIEANLDQSVEADAIRNDILTIRRQFELDSDASELIGTYPDFLEALAGLKYAFKRHSERSADGVGQSTRKIKPGPADGSPSDSRRRRSKTSN